MKKLLILLAVILVLAVPAKAEEYTAPTPPDDALELIPQESVSFGEDLWTIVTAAIKKWMPSLADAAVICGSVTAIALLTAILKCFPGNTAKVTDLAGTLAVSLLLLNATGTMIQLGAETVTEISDYEKLLLPVMTAAMAAQGGVTTSGMLYTGSALFNAVLSALITKIMIPFVYLFLAASVASNATGEALLKRISDSVKSMATWCLKTILYLFTGYMGITGVVSGTVDAAALKATKLTMSGMIPVVGGILSDASEAVIVGASVVKNAVGVYGLLAAIAIWISPFIRIGIQYLLLKLTAILCEAIGSQRISQLIQSFSAAMGLLLGMTGAVCLMTLVSTICFMKGVS